MCARFDFDEGVREEALAAAHSRNPAVYELKAGEVRPAAPALVLAGHRGKVHAGLMTWGLPRYDGKGLIINTRAETASEKAMFRESLKQRRCVIPARAFHEWDRQKRKVTFSLPQVPVLYLAGIYQVEAGVHRYSVLTTAANGAVLPFHDRMPVLLAPSDLPAWLLDPESAGPLLSREMPQLESFQEPEAQISLF